MNVTKLKTAAVVALFALFTFPFVGALSGTGSSIIQSSEAVCASENCGAYHAAYYCCPDSGCGNYIPRDDDSAIEF